MLFSKKLKSVYVSWLFRIRGQLKKCPSTTERAVKMVSLTSGVLFSMYSKYIFVIRDVRYTLRWQLTF